MEVTSATSYISSTSCYTHVQKTSAGNEMPLGMVATTDPASKTLHAVMTILLEEVLGFHLRPDFFDSSTDIMYALSGCLQNVQGDNSCLGNITVEEPKYHIGINVWLTPETQKARTFLEMALPSRLPWQVGDNTFAMLQEGLFVAKAVIDAAHNDSGMVLEHYKTYSAVSSPKKYFDSLSDFSHSELLECSESTIWNNAGAMGNYAQFSSDYGGVELQPDGSYKATCYDGHWWIAPSCRGNASMCIPVLTFGDNLLQAIMQWAAAYDMPFGIANFDSREWYQNHDPERFRSLFYRSTASVEFLKFSPEPIQLPRHDVEEWSQGNQRTAPAEHAAAHFASSNLENKSWAVLHSFLTRWRLELDGALSQLSSDRDGQRAAACRWVREIRARWEFWKMRNTTCSEGSGLATPGGSFASSRADAVGCRACAWPMDNSEALTDSFGTTFRCTLYCEAPLVKLLKYDNTCGCPAGVVGWADLELFVLVQKG